MRFAVVCLSFCLFVLAPAVCHSEDGDLPLAQPRHKAKAWVELGEGARPAYVGIQGGTAPLRLLRAADGAVFSMTGNTGNDFVHLLDKGVPTENATRVNPEALTLVEALPSVQSVAELESVAAAPAEEVLPESLQPFGLNNPHGVTAEVAQATEPETPPFSPLRLGSYARLLGYRGSL
ncbi:MAG: hypothetical protein LBH65_00170 [Desulfovibrio sp.]|nr:hypothetical protein [Desulfovibrio sp.]